MPPWIFDFKIIVKAKISE